MTVDWTINITGLVSLVGAIVAGVVAWVTTANRVTAHHARLLDLQGQIGVLTASIKMMQDRIEDTRAKAAHELAEFKIEVAKSYATNAAIQQVEERVVSAIEKIGERVDRALDGQRLERSRREPP